MKQYLEILKDVYNNGVKKGDRTGTGTHSVFGRQIRFDLSEGFPLLTTKKLHLKSIIYELLWFIKGDTNVKYLNDHDVHIWDAWANSEGDLGPIYSASWRRWPTRDGKTIDQLGDIVNTIRNNPDSRRMVVSAWNVEDLPKMALSPCHCIFQFFVADGKLSCQLYQRSADIFLGVPFNIGSYALLTMMIAKITGLEVGEFIHTFGDLHLYSNHVSQAREQLHREPQGLPTMKILGNQKEIEDFKYEDFQIEGYHPLPSIKAPIAV